MDLADAEKDCEAGQRMKIFLYKRAESICLSKNQSLWWDMFSLCVIHKARKKKINMGGEKLFTLKESVGISTV